MHLSESYGVVFFCDVVNFTNLCNIYEAHEIVFALDKLFTQCDAMCLKHKGVRVDVVGDCYIAFFCGACAGANTCSAAEEFLRVSDASQGPEGPLRVRIGVCAGPVTWAAVAGKESMFGPTVNCAARVQTSGFPGCAHASASFLELLMKEAGGIGELSTRMTPCGDIQLKGFGNVPTYVLHVGNNYAQACLQRALQRRYSEDPEFSRSAALRKTKWNSISHMRV